MLKEMARRKKAPWGKGAFGARYKRKITGSNVPVQARHNQPERTPLVF